MAHNWWWLCSDKNGELIGILCEAKSEECLFREDRWDSTLTYPLLTAGVVEMKEKLCMYAKNQLPGGKYREPEPEVEAVLQEIKVNNDLCESLE